MAVFGIPWTTRTPARFRGRSSSPCFKDVDDPRHDMPANRVSFGHRLLAEAAEPVFGSDLDPARLRAERLVAFPSPSGPVRPPATENVQVFESAPTAVTVSVQGSINRGASWSTRLRPAATRAEEPAG